MLKTYMKDGVAIGGYDLTEYFRGAPKKGSVDFRADHDGTTYYFASAENRAAFEADPERYLPQFNGWCSVAVSEGNYFYADPLSFVIQDGKLYLFWDDHVGGATRPTWEADPANRQKSAHEYWAGQKLNDENLKPEDRA